VEFVKERISQFFFYFGIENVFESIKGKEEKKQLKIFYVNQK
jgi:hypothetical protein